MSQDSFERLQVKYRLSQASLRELEAQFRTTFDHASIGIGHLQPDGRWLRLNQKYCDMLGYSQREMMLKTLDEITHPEDRRIDAEFIRRMLDRESPVFEFEKRYLHKNGSVVWANIMTRLWQSSPGSQTYFITFCQDITDKKASQAKLAAASKLSALGEMAAGIAHEINNPLAIIQLVAQDLKEIAASSQDWDKVKKNADHVEKTVTRISKIVRALKFMGREGSSDPFQETPLNTMIEDVLEVCRERFSQNQIELTFYRPPEKITIRCRPVQISQVLLNLLSNAYDAAGALEEGKRWVAMGAQVKEHFVELCVTDGGPGILPEFREKVFQPFYTSKDVGKGTGLGLSVSRGIVQDHFGELFLDESSENTRFVIRLPRKA